MHSPSYNKVWPAQNVISGQVERSCLGIPGEKKDIGAHVVASYFIPGTGFRVLETNESTQLSYFAV